MKKPEKKVKPKVEPETLWMLHDADGFLPGFWGVTKHAAEERFCGLRNCRGNGVRAVRVRIAPVKPKPTRRGKR